MTLKTIAILNLAPNASWLSSESGEISEWLTPEVAQPSNEEIASEMLRIQASQEALQYMAKRAAEYPPITDYLDAVVKGDQAQVAKYIADCQAVKAKYPKP